MIPNLFNLATNEATAGSVFYLGSLFGNIGNVLPGTGPQLMGTMFQVFNTSVLALGSIILIYTNGVGILMTAHEGEFLGKKFHSVWTPIRTIAGVAALVPTATGYSSLQIVLMWVIIQGIGAADTLWTKTIEYVAQGNATAPTNPLAVAAAAATGTNAGLTSTVQTLFEDLTCQAALKSPDGDFCSSTGSGKGSPFCTQSDNDMLDIAANQNGTCSGCYKIGPSGECGTLAWGIGIDSAVTQAKQQAFQQIVPLLGGIAAQLVSIDNEYNQFYKSDPTTPAPAWLSQYCTDKHITPCTRQNINYPAPIQTTALNSNTVTDLYWPYGVAPFAGGNFINAVATLYTGMVGNAMTQGQQGLPLDKNKVEGDGWIFAGAYFYTLAGINNQVQTNVGSIDVTSSTTLPGYAQTLYSVAQNLVTKIQDEQSAGASAGPSSPEMNIPCGDFAGLHLNTYCRDFLGSWISTLSGGSYESGALSQNPVVAAQGWGAHVLYSLEIAFPFIFGISVGLSIAGATFMGNGIPEIAMIGDIFLMGPLLFFAMIFLGLGVTFAVYIPMIPYMLFTFGAIGWLTATIESMVAAPLVALALLYPEGGHDIWGKAEQSFMIILNIFMRPSLMIFGMIGGMLLSYVAVMLLNSAFYGVVNLLGQSSFLEFLFFMVLYTSIFTTILNKCFELIHLIPDEVLRWIGGGGKQFGEAGGLEKVGGAFKGGEEKTAGAIKGGGEGAKAGIAAVGKKAAKTKGAKQGPGNVAPG